MSKNHHICNQCVEMSHDLMIEIHFNPKSIYMKTHKNGVDTLTRDFSQRFCKSTGGRVVDQYRLQNIILIKAEICADTFALLEVDYERFIDTVFSGISLRKFGVSELAVFSHAQKKLQTKQQSIENA